MPAASSAAAAEASATLPIFALNVAQLELTERDLEQLGAATAAEEVQIAREVTHHPLEPGELIFN
jgi:hypothetical protein